LTATRVINEIKGVNRSIQVEIGSTSREVPNAVRMERLGMAPVYARVLAMVAPLDKRTSIHYLAYLLISGGAKYVDDRSSQRDIGGVG
jgi:hypothetical protein